MCSCAHTTKEERSLETNWIKPFPSERPLPCLLLSAPSLHQNCFSSLTLPRPHVWSLPLQLLLIPQVSGSSLPTSEKCACSPGTRLGLVLRGPASHRHGRYPVTDPPPRPRYTVQSATLRRAHRHHHNETRVAELGFEPRRCRNRRTKIPPSRLPGHWCLHPVTPQWSTPAPACPAT